ncbi:MAG: flagellar hook capping protein [Lachnospiraceae bacterium]|nr:flagellar hook capping protein [Lachnospiraceae bacterium]
MSSTVAPVVDGKLDLGTTATAETKSNALDKNAFLQLLVAQMKYQDPLEPTSNTEYISQLATFSQLEEMQNLTANNELQRASSLVGKEVTVKITSESGNVTYDTGKVNYVVYENGKALLGINGEEYSLDDVDTVVDSEYLEAYSMASAVVTAVSKLPSVANLSISNKAAVLSIKEVYESMNEYQKSFISKEDQKLIEEYFAKMEKLIKNAEASEETEGSSDSTSGESGQNNTGSGE